MISDFEQDYGPSAADSNEMNNQFERFELLSAYMDGEATTTERQQVQQWLDTDPQFHELYKQLLRLQREIPTVPVPPPPLSTQQLSDSVFEKIDRQRNTRKLIFFGGFAIAAVFVGAVSSLWLREASLSSRYANHPLPTPGETEHLTIALNRPIVEIPTSIR